MKMIQVRLALITTMAFIVSAVGYADDTFFGGKGSILYPSSKTTVRMVSEKVNIKRNKKDVLVDCEFVFNNPDKNAEITMGFPAEPRIDYNDEKEDVSYDLNDLLIKDFTLSIDGVEKKCELLKVSNEEIKDINMKYAYVWKCTFPKKKQVYIKHTYRYGISGDSGGSVWIGYVMKTGALWAGKMDKAEITLDLNEKIPTKFLKITPSGYEYKGGVVKWTYLDFKPTADINVKIDPRYYQTAYTHNAMFRVP